jgi:hypothetical protein
VLILAACYTSRYGEKITKSQFEFASYSISAPKGDWGISKNDPAAEEIQFSMTRSWGTVGEVQVSTLGVSKIPITASGAEMTEEALVEEYLATEERNVSEQGKATKAYAIKDVRKGVENVGGKKVYFLRYRTNVHAWGEGATLLYVYFPPDWKSRRAFYNFIIDEAWKTDMFGVALSGVSRDPKVVEPLVASFATR